MRLTPHNFIQDRCRPPRAPRVPSVGVLFRARRPGQWVSVADGAAEEGRSADAPSSVARGLAGEGVAAPKRRPGLSVHVDPHVGRVCRGVLEIFFFKDHPKGPLQGTTNRHQPPTATNRQLPTAANRQRRRTANRQPLLTATNHQSPTTNRRQPPPTVTNRQSPTANRHPPPTANHQSPPTMVEDMSYTRSFCKTAVQEHVFFLLRTPLRVCVRVHDADAMWGQCPGDFWCTGSWKGRRGALGGLQGGHPERAPGKVADSGPPSVATGQPLSVNRQPSAALNGGYRRRRGILLYVRELGPDNLPQCQLDIPAYSRPSNSNKRRRKRTTHATSVRQGN